jgi:hypothetical protein
VAGFNFTELEAGEEFVFGPVTSTKTTSVRGGSGPDQAGLSHTSGRTVGVTTQRVIVEDLKAPEKTLVVPNADVQRVFIKHKKRQDQMTIDLTKAVTVAGQAVKLDIKGVPSQAEGVLRETFPNAEIVQAKGGAGGKVVLIVAAAVFFLMCVLPVIILLLLRMFGN